MALANYDILIVLAFSALVVAGIFLILKRTKNKTRNISTLRVFVQAAALVFIFMGLILGPFNTPLWRPLGISPRDRILGGDFLANQLPDGIPVPILACYFPNGRTVTCPIWQIQAYIFPFWDYPRGYQVNYSTPGLEKLAIVVGSLVAAGVVLGRWGCGWL